MNTQSNAMPESSSDSQIIESRILAPAVTAIHRFYWSVRRELWENRSIYIAPLAVASVTLLGYLIASLGRALSTSDLAQRRAVLVEPYSFALDVITVTAFIVGIFYSLDALHGERRDRSILFWKSLPVSDLTTVLSKASIPLIVLPLISFAILVATELIMLGLGSTVLSLSGLSVAAIWIPLFQVLVRRLYSLVTLQMLWNAPIYSWFLLVSGWARRAGFLWATLPWLAVCALEKIAFNTTDVAAMLGHRFEGGVPTYPTMLITPAIFLTSPSVWIGLVVAVAFLAAAVRLRRCQGSI
jgi:ABC-2 type transport system permease protein